MSRETKCALHIVHVSSKAGVRLVQEAARAGVDVTCETCPHYLVLNENDVERIGALAKCEPPIRDEFQRKQLLHEVALALLDHLVDDRLRAELEGLLDEADHPRREPAVDEPAQS